MSARATLPTCAKGRPSCAFPTQACAKATRMTWRSPAKARTIQVALEVIPTDYFFRSERGREGSDIFTRPVFAEQGWRYLKAERSNPQPSAHNSLYASSLRRRSFLVDCCYPYSRRRGAAHGRPCCFQD